MAKKAEEKQAYVYYVEKGWTAKDASKQVGVTEATMSKWVNKNGWDELRTAREINPNSLIKIYYTLLNKLLSKRLDYENNEKIESSEYKGVIDEISKISKNIRELEQKGRPSLHVYIHCIERFCDSLRQFNPEIYFKIVDFQKQNILEYAKEVEL